MNKAVARSEKRKHARVSASIPVRYRIEGDDTKTLREGSLTTDVCEGGLRFITSEFIATPCRLVLELDVPAQSQPVKAVSQVAWVKDKSPGKQYEVGGEFMEISKKDQARITQFLEGH
jgi:hypothetical protein